MGESNPVAVELDHAPSLGELDVVDTGASQRLQHCHRRCRERRHGSERVPDACRQDAQPMGDDRPQALGQLDAGIRGADRAVDKSTPQLHREERIAPGDPVNTHDHRPRDGDPEPPPQQPMNRSHRERLDRKPPERAEGAVELERHPNRPPTHRREDGHRLGVQPPQHEREHLRRARVEPLGIVQRDQHRALLGQSPHRRKQRERENARVGKHVIRLPNQQRSLQSTPL